MQINRLNVLDLHRKINQKTEKKSLCYDRVLEICHKRITAQADNMKLTCWFEFPEYIVGYPLFDLNACMEYCKKHLIANGFLVRYFFPNRFYISWDFDEIKKQKDEERKKIPLVAVLPPPKSQSNDTQSHAIDNRVPFEQDGRLPVIPLPQTPPNAPLLSPMMPTVPSFPAHLHAKITSPLPPSPPQYDPFDLYNASPSVRNTDVKSTAIDNTLFPKDFKEILTSSIGSGNKKNLFDYKPSGKVTLNL